MTQHVRLMTFSHVTEDGMEHDGWVLRIEDLPDAVLKAIGNGKTIELHAYKELEEVVRKKCEEKKVLHGGTANDGDSTETRTWSYDGISCVKS